jgi:hypothetical protein
VWGEPSRRTSRGSGSRSRESSKRSGDRFPGGSPAIRFRVRRLLVVNVVEKATGSSLQLAVPGGGDDPRPCEKPFGLVPLVLAAHRHVPSLPSRIKPPRHPPAGGDRAGGATRLLSSDAITSRENVRDDLRGAVPDDAEELENLLEELPPHRRSEVIDFARFLREQEGSADDRRLSLSWAGGLSHLRDEYTAEDLEEEALDLWRKGADP